MPYIGVYMKMLGLSPTETAIITGTVPIFTGILRTPISGLADKLNAHKRVILILCLLAAVFHCCMWFVPQITTPGSRNMTVDVELHCGTNGAHVFACNGDWAVDDQVGIPVSVGDEAGVESHVRNGSRYLSFSANACKWTCSVRQQHNKTKQTEDICFTRSHEKNCLTLHYTTTFEFGVSKLQLRPVEECRAMVNSVTDEAVCRCYTIQSFIVDDDAFDRIVCQEQTTLACSIDYVDDGVSPVSGAHNQSRGTSSTDRKGFNFGWIFWSVAILFFLGQLAFQPVFGLIDAVTLTFIGDERNKWGRQRLWGTIGFASFGLASGLLMDTSDSDKNMYTVAFVLFATLLILAAVSTCQYNIKGLDLKCSPHVLRDVVSLVRRPDAFVLLILILVFGMYNGFIVTFLFWYLQLLGEVPQVLFGMCLVLNCLPEIVMLFFSGSILQRIGHVFSMSIVCVVFAVRLASYSVIQNPWMVLVIEPLHSVTYGLMYAAAITYASSITPPGTHGSVQSIIGSLHFSFGKF